MAEQLDDGVKVAQAVRKLGDRCRSREGSLDNEALVLEGRAMSSRKSSFGQRCYGNRYLRMMREHINGRGMFGIGKQRA
ncbi:hypothetical protein E2562_037497 [Oryza meyeriana var. granulata]|uniref:Uncharacterized protein n=1 Tax=Oryza meyeriana var. granulata TaxID=110450 RepID=A0A6G1EU14_9ORYZ|nr:hypothetical protein E2562_037497 [Oryza meyeriana var. granulata]